MYKIHVFHHLTLVLDYQIDYKENLIFQVPYHDIFYTYFQVLHIVV